MYEIQAARPSEGNIRGWYGRGKLRGLSPTEELWVRSRDTRVNLCTNTGGNSKSRWGSQRFPGREGRLSRSPTEKRNPLCFFVKDLHIGGDTGKAYVTAALPIPCANVLADAPFPHSLLPCCGHLLLTMRAYRPSSCDTKHACTVPGRPVWLDPFDPPDSSASHSRPLRTPNPRVSWFTSNTIEPVTSPHVQIGRAHV